MNPEVAFGDAQALTTCLAVEGFLLATVSLAATLGSAGRRRVAKLPVSAFTIAMAAALLSCLVGAAAFASWLGLFGEGSLLPARQLLIAVILLVVLATQPIIAVFLALGTRTED